MRFTVAASIFVLAVAPCLAPARAAEAPTQEQAKQAAREFGRSLTSADASILRPLLPQRGKVRLLLLRLGGPEEGAYSSGQVEALIAGFLRQGSVGRFEIVRSEGDRNGYGYALVHGRVQIVDRSGQPAVVHLHLTFEPEEGRWVLREIRETPA